jgi:hypothetical protein
VKAAVRLSAFLAGAALLCVPARAEMALEAVDFDLAQTAGQDAPVEDGAETDRLPALSLAEAASVDISEIALQDAPVANRDPGLRLSFGEHVRSIQTELLIGFGYMTAVNIAKIASRGGVTGRFRFHDEGLFGKDTRELGVDKLVHAHNSYVLSEIIGARIRAKTGTSRGTAVSGAILGSGLMIYSELYDGFKRGWGWYDVAFNTAGAAFSVIRNTTPGLSEKLDFRALVIPNDQIYSPTGKKHYRQLRYLFALELGGFEGMRSSPLRFVELHAGYYGKGFTNEEEERGEERKRKLFAGVGINLNELLFNRNPKGRTARAASQLLDYWQPPYTYVHAK